MYFSPEELKKIINGLFNIQDKTNKQNVNYSAQGPGYLDGFLFLEGDENCWEKREAPPNVLTLPKQKIIFSNTYLINKTHLKALDFDIISTLIAHYDVYLWSGETNISESEPIKDSKTFWETYYLTVSASTEEIKKCLAYQGINVHHCLILGDGIYQEITNTLRRSSTHSMLLKDSSLLSKDSLKIGFIKYIEMTDCDLINLNLSNFPQLFSLKITNCTNLSFPKENLNILKFLTLEQCNLEQLDITQFPFLEDLEIIYCLNVSLKNLERLPLKVLFIKNTEFIENLCYPAKLEELYVESPHVYPCNITNLKHLKSLNIEHKTITNNLDLSRCNDLRKLYINTENAITIFGIQSLIKLFLLDLCVPDLEKNGILHQVIELLKNESCTVSLYAHTNLYDNKLKSFINWASHLEKQQNANSPVSYFVLSDKISIDSNTGLDETPYTANTQEGCRIELTAKESPDRDIYRLTPFIKIEIQDNKICFVKEEDDEKNLIPIETDTLKFTDEEGDLAQIAQEVQSSEDFYLGYIQGKLGKTFPLPTHQSLNKDSIDKIEWHKILYYKNESTFFPIWGKDIALYWHKLYHQFYIELQPNLTNKEIFVLYRYKQNPVHETYDIAPENYSLKPWSLIKELAPDSLLFSFIDKIASFFEDSNNTLLPKALKDAIEQLIQETDKLKFLHDKKLPPEEKINRLIDYCSAFTNEALEDNQEAGSIAQLLQLIIRQKGSCRHRCWVFMALAHYLGIHAILWINENHAFCEIPYYDKNGKIYWRHANFGGAPIIDHTHENARKPIFDRKNIEKGDTKNNNNTIQENKKKTPTKKPKKETQFSKTSSHTEKKEEYYQAIKSLVEPEAIFSFDSFLIQSHSLSPLILLKENQDPFNVHACMASHIDLYIHNAQDFKRFLKPYCLRNGERTQVKGPLKKLLKIGGTLLVNWNNFTSAEMASYKSILDTEPTLLGKTVSKDFKVIGLINENIPLGEAFASRCKPFTLSSDLIEENPGKQILIENTTEIIEIDLFNSFAWRELLLGKVRFKGHEIILEEGALIKAIRKNCPLKIYNCPEDNALKVLLHRVAVERKILYNGDWIDVPDNVVITTETRINDLKLDNVQVSQETAKKETLKYRQPIYLNLSNLHECKERLHFDATRQAITLSGLLETYTDQAYFYLTDSLSQSDWQVLLAHIKTHYPDKAFEFVLAPGITIEGIESSEEISISENAFNVFISNDVDLACEEFKEQYSDVWVIDITPDMTFSDLIAKMKIKTQNGKTHFSYKESAVLRALQEEKTVILKGALSPTLYQQLLPLLSHTSPHIHCNGERINITGKLMAVQPESVLSYLPFLTKAQQKIYTRSDYESHFSSKDQLFVDKIYNFYDEAEKLHQSGPGRPEKLTLSYARLKRMVNALKNPLHKKNPIKGLFHYDYPKGSPLYKALNDLAKRIFYSESLPQKKKKSNFQIDKREQQLKILLENPENTLIILKGLPGVGKTYSVRNLQAKLGFKMYDGKDNILQWLESSTQKLYSVLLLDEANMHKPGVWDFLKGLNSKEKIIYYKDKSYTLTEKHKIIATGNPEHYSNRYYHSFFQHHGETVYFKMPGDDELKEIFLSPMNPKNAQKIIQVYQFITEINPLFTYSLRDFENITARFELLFKDLRYHAVDKKILMAKACAIEFSGSLIDPEKRQRFLEKLVDIFGLATVDEIEGIQDNTPLIHLHEDIFIPQEYAALVESIRQDVALRFSSTSKKCALIEGDPGLGKSTLFEALLKAEGLQYIKISAGPTAEVIKQLEEAFHLGIPVILDELNLDDNLEYTINQLLTGVDTKGKTPENPGFILLASQNAGVHPGCKPISQALRNRCHTYYMQPYSREALINVAEHYGKENSYDFYKAFKQVKVEFPQTTNTRTYYNAVKI